MLNHYAVYVKLITWEVNSISIKNLKGSIVIYGMCCLSFSFSLWSADEMPGGLEWFFVVVVHERMIEYFRGTWQLCENELNCQPSEILLVVNCSKHSSFWNNKLRQNKTLFGKSSLGSAYRKNWNYWALLFYHIKMKVQQWKDRAFWKHKLCVQSSFFSMTV